MITGALRPLATARSIEELKRFRLMSAAQAPTAIPYGNRIFGPRTNKDITAAIAAIIIVYLVVCFFVSDILPNILFPHNPKVNMSHKDRPCGVPCVILGR